MREKSTEIWTASSAILLILLTATGSAWVMFFGSLITLLIAPVLFRELRVLSAVRVVLIACITSALLVFLLM